MSYFNASCSQSPPRQRPHRPSIQHFQASFATFRRTYLFSNTPWKEVRVSLGSIISKGRYKNKLETEHLAARLQRNVLVTKKKSLRRCERSREGQAGHYTWISVGVQRIAVTLENFLLKFVDVHVAALRSVFSNIIYRPSISVRTNVQNIKVYNLVKCVKKVYSNSTSCPIKGTQCRCWAHLTINKFISRVNDCLSTRKLLGKDSKKFIYTRYAIPVRPELEAILSHQELIK